MGEGAKIARKRTLCDVSIDCKTRPPSLCEILNTHLHFWQLTLSWKRSHLKKSTWLYAPVRFNEIDCSFYLRAGSEVDKPKFTVS